MDIETLEAIGVSAARAFESVRTMEEFRLREIEFLGRKSELSLFLKTLSQLSPEERHRVGALGNTIKRHISEARDIAKLRLERASFDAESEWIDVTDPKESFSNGHFHVLRRVERDIRGIFCSLGFDVADGPEVETEFYNFDALNIPTDHPARDMQDTFWIRSGDPSSRFALRSQTSAVQVRYMETHTPPFRIIVPGKCFRAEATDSTHEHTFHQFEMLCVDESANIGHLKYVAELFFSRFFGKAVHVRLRPSYFPFVEPGFEFDISCLVCDGSGCSSCRGAGWLELGGAGMVNQNVFVSAGYERDRYRGYAWGFGLERLAMMKYKISDIRLFHSGDLRFLNQF